MIIVYLKPYDLHHRFVYVQEVNSGQLRSTLKEISKILIVFIYFNELYTDEIQKISFRE